MAVDSGLQQSIDAISVIVFPLADPRISYSRGWERPGTDARYSIQWEKIEIFASYTLKFR